jgi:hypothetical protein
MRKLLAGFVICFSYLAFAQSPQDTGSFKGILFERGTKKPLEGINIFILPAKLKATTGADGSFILSNLPEGDFELVVNASGYKKITRQGYIGAGGNLTYKLFLERDTYQGLEATVVGKVTKRDEARKTLKTEQFLTLPGSGGDPVKAIQNLPGVARVAGFSSQVIIQGSAPQDTVYQLDDHDVPLVFHFGGLTSIVTPEGVGSVDYFSAGYGPEYGRAMGGIVGLKTKDPATERMKGMAFMDTTKAGALLEGPINEKSSFLVSGRYSYLGYVLKAALKDNSNFDLTVAPAFGDLNVVYKLKVSEQDDFRFSGIYSHDELSFLLKEPLRSQPSVRGNFDNSTNFYRLIPQWTHKFDADTVGKISVAFGQNLFRVDAGQNYFDLNETVLTQRAEYESKPSGGWKSFLGLDNSYGHQVVSLKLPQVTGGGGVNNPISSGSLVDVAITRDDIELSPYWRNELHANGSKWTWMPGLRVDYFNVTNEVKPEPRIAVRFEEDDSLKYKAATGIYYQAPGPQESAPQYGNPDIKAPYAIHYTAGFEKDLHHGTSEGFVVSSDLFYRTFENLVVKSSRIVSRDGTVTPENYNNEGRGRSFGLEMMVKYDAKDWSGWLSYTLSRSLRNEPGQDEHLFQYDQTHNVNLVGSYDFANNWKVSGRVRYVTGNPNTPITGGTFDSDNDVYVPSRGPFYSERNADFFQLDTRIDKKWIHDTWIFSAYLDVQNITNRQNSEGIRYSYDYSQKQDVSGLPVLPTVGIKGEF